MIVSFQEESENSVRMVIEKEVVLSEEYRGLSAKEIIDKVREKNRIDID